MYHTFLLIFFLAKTVCERDVVIIIDISTEAVLQDSQAEIANLISTYKIGRTSLMVSIVAIDSQLYQGKILSNFSSEATSTDLNLLNFTKSLTSDEIKDDMASNNLLLNDTFVEIGNILLPSGRLGVPNVVIAYWDGSYSFLSNMQEFYNTHHDDTR